MPELEREKQLISTTVRSGAGFVTSERPRSLFVQRFPKWAVMRMKRSREFFFVAALFLVIGKSSACLPPEEEGNSLGLIRKKFNSVDTVLIARVVDTRKKQVKLNNIDFAMDAEINTFLVVKSFKGKYNVGDTFVLTTVLSGCGVSAVNDPPSFFNPDSGQPLPISKDWLLYMNMNANAGIRNSPWTSPLDLVTREELTILEEWGQRQFSPLKK